MENSLKSRENNKRLFDFKTIVLRRDIPLTHSFPALSCYDMEVCNAQPENNKLPACQSIVNNQDLNSYQWKDLRKEAEEEIDQEAVGAKILNDINSIDLKGIGDLPMEVILCVVIVKFGLAVVCAICLPSYRHCLFCLQMFVMKCLLRFGQIYWKMMQMYYFSQSQS